MCGIAGLYLKFGESIDKDLLTKMASTMSHRGPDAGGVYVHQNIGLAHRRLSVIDLSESANQPLFNQSKTLSIVYNGEVYNFLELRQELEALGFRFQTKSDTEVILCAFEQWGEAAFRKLNGMFAFAILDQRTVNPVFYLVRDRFGIKPLFYSQNDQKLAFASEMKPLYLLDWIDQSTAPETLFYFLKFSHVPNPLSIVRGIQQLEPGTFLKIQRKNKNSVFSHHTYWSPLELTEAEPFSSKLSEENLLQSIEEILTNSVKRQLVSDVPIGCFLSGGIDSSLLVSSSRDAGKKHIKTFTIGYDQPDAIEFNESKYAEEIARAFQTEHYSINVTPKDLLDLIPMIPSYYDQPLGDPTLLSTLLLAKFARTQVTVALSGDGSDEIFFGYPYQRVLHHLEHQNLFPTVLRQTTMGLIEATTRPSRITKLFPTLQKMNKAAQILQFQSEAELFQYFIGTIGPMKLDRLKHLLTLPTTNTSLHFQNLLSKMKHLNWDQKIEQIFIRTFLTDTVLAKTDRAGMSFGLEARVPFLDDEIVAFSAKLPHKYKLNGNQGKYLLRKLLKKKLEQAGVSTELSRRKKQGFSIPLREWFRSDLKPLIRQYLDETKVRRDGIFNFREVKLIIQEHDSGQANHSHLIWSLLSFQMWKDKYQP